MHIQKKYDGVPPPRTRTDMRFAAALRRWRFFSHATLLHLSKWIGLRRGRETAVFHWMNGNRGKSLEGKLADGYQLRHWHISRFSARSAAHAFPSMQAKEEHSPCRQSPLVQDSGRRGTTICCVWEGRSFVSEPKPTVNGGLSRAAVCGTKSNAWSRARRHPRHRQRYCGAWPAAM